MTIALTIILRRKMVLVVACTCCEYAVVIYELLLLGALMNEKHGSFEGGLGTSFELCFCA